MFVAFDGSRARWAAGGEAAEAAAALQALRRGLLAAVKQQQQHTGGDGGGAAAHPALQVVHADALPGWQAVAPPTASGFLLAYPALYLCHSLEEVQAATRGLSSGSLCLHQLACALAAAGVPQLDPWEQPLLAFSVPAELVSTQEWEQCLAGWRGALEARHCAAAAALGSAGAWAPPQLRITLQPPRPVAL
jgi:hypothetical protein